MNFSLLGAAIGFLILGAIDYRKSGWLPLQRPIKITVGSLAAWLIDRIYLLYAVTAAAVLVAAILVPPN